MPWAPKRPCTHPGCGALTLNGQCDQHRKRQRREMDASRGTSTRRGYGVRWQAARAAYLAEHLWCATCQAAGRRELATVVDHVRPHKGDMELFWDEGNWQALCKRCHDKKTTKEGRWG